MRSVLVVLNKFLHPPGWVLVCSPVVFGMLIAIFVTGQTNSALAYLIYGMSAYCLVILLLPLPKWIRGIKTFIVRRLTGTAIGRRYISDLAFRGSVSIYQGMMVNFLYLVFRIILSIQYASVWFLSMAVYYLVLGVLRLLLILDYRHRDCLKELHSYRRTAWLLFLLNIPMGGMILLMVLTDSGYSYPGSFTDNIVRYR